MIKFTLLAYAGLMALACVTTVHSVNRPAEPGSPAIATEAPAAPAFAGTTEAPLTATLHGPPSVAAGESIIIRLDVERRIVNGNPIDVHLSVPDGCVLESGVSNERVIDARSPRIVREYKLVVNHVPQSDLVVTADSAGSNYGVHASAAYRFGRPEPKLRQPNLPPVGLTGGPKR